MKKRTIRIFVDFDGTLVPFDKSKSLEEVAARGYSLTLKPFPSVVELIRHLAGRADCEVVFLSSVLNGFAADDKRTALKNLFGEKVASAAVFPLYGEEKDGYVEKMFGRHTNDILIDDYSRNLHGWSGIGVKMFNGINGSNGTWHGMSLRADMDAEFMMLIMDAYIHYAHSGCHRFYGVDAGIPA